MAEGNLTDMSGAREALSRRLNADRLYQRLNVRTKNALYNVAWFDERFTDAPVLEICQAMLKKKFPNIGKDSRLLIADAIAAEYPDSAEAKARSIEVTAAEDIERATKLLGQAMILLKRAKAKLA